MVNSYIISQLRIFSIKISVTNNIKHCTHCAAHTRVN